MSLRFLKIVLTSPVSPEKRWNKYQQVQCRQKKGEISIKSSGYF